jgi:hypothetical protein
MYIYDNCITYFIIRLDGKRACETSINIGVKVILKWAVNKQKAMLWICFNQFGTGSGGGFL